ncbi:DUF2523 family protein [Acinetobacter colistiniresistens]|uniref:DUF2523 family protein n=1 Tax=Acinetobacter colistiniresistens TaxID=280145 RepID=UPI000DD0438D|nr:DUF2523 family protein [Acinetobacter colistiniresistens]
MWAILANLLTALLGSAIGRMLTGAGLTLATYVGLSSVVGQLQADLSANLNSIPAEYLGLIGILKFDFYCSALFSAFTIAAASKAMKTFIKTK